MAYRRSWLLNPNPNRYKQLEFVLNKMPVDKAFTANDMKNWHTQEWENHGQISSRGKLRKRYDYNTQNFTRFLKYRKDVREVGVSIGDRKLWKSNKNVMDRKI